MQSDTYTLHTQIAVQQTRNIIFAESSLHDSIPVALLPFRGGMW